LALSGDGAEQLALGTTDLGRCLEPVVASQASMVKSVKQVATYGQASEN